MGRITSKESQQRERFAAWDRPWTLSYLCRVVHLCSCIALTLCVGCQQAAIDATSTQRGLNEATLSASGASIEVLPGVVRTTDAEDPSFGVRLSAGVGRVVLRTNEVASGLLTITLDNLHPDAEVAIRRVRRLTTGATLENACPPEDASLDVICAQTPDDTRCTPPQTTRAEDRPTRRSFETELAPCREIILEAYPPADELADEVSFVVLGEMASPQTLRAVAEAQASASHDFFVTTGDALAEEGSAAIEAFDDVAARLDRPVLALVGEQELGEDEGVAFEQRFGAFDYRWTLGDIQFVTFYTAELRLAPRGLSNLESFLMAMEREDQRWRADNAYTLPEGDARALPSFALTYAPPFDPRGVRGQGFVSRNEAARTLSLLADYDIKALFAGHVDSTDVLAGRPVTRTVHSTREGVAGGDASYLVVRLTAEDRPGATRVNNRFLTVDIREIP